MAKRAIERRPTNSNAKQALRSNPLSALNSPMGDLAIGGISTLINAIESDKARRQNEALLGRIPKGGMTGTITGSADFLAQNLLPFQEGQLDRLGTRRRNLLGLQERDTTNLRQLLEQEQGGLRGAYDRGSAELLAGGRKRQADVLGLLEGLGEQEKRDIRRDFEGLRGQMQASLTNRGLAGTSMVPSLFTGIQRRQSEALGGAEERIRGQRAGALANLSGDVLNLLGARTAGREGLTGQQAGQRLGFEEGRRGQRLGMQDVLSAEDIAARQGFADQNVNLFTDLRKDMLNTLAGVNIGYPDQGAFLGGLQGLGNFRGAQQYVDSLSSGGLFSGGGAAMGGAAGAAAGLGLGIATGPGALLPLWALGGAAIGGTAGGFAGGGR